MEIKYSKIRIRENEEAIYFKIGVVKERDKETYLTLN